MSATSTSQNVRGQSEAQADRSSCGEKVDKRSRAARDLDFVLTCGRLKRLQRAGWVRAGVTHPESVADHMYRMAMCAWLVPNTEQGVDRSKLMRMALVHDLAEAVVGDITPYDLVSQEEKHRMEEKGLRSILADLSDEATKAEVYGLFREYEEAITTEAKLCHEIDKLDMAVTAYSYEAEKANGTQSKDLDLEQFYESSRPAITSSIFKPIFDELIERRKVHLEVVEPEPATD